MLLAAGSAVVVNNVLGYSSLNVTSRYFHVANTSMKSALEAMALVVSRAAATKKKDGSWVG